MSSQPAVEGTRKWPPGGWWLFSQRYERLLWAHWQVESDAIRHLVPDELEIDTFRGSAWISVAALHMVKMHMRYVPYFGNHNCPEVETRTYVKAGEKSGVWFFSLDTPGRLRAWIGRTLLHLPWHAADTSLIKDGDATIFSSSRSGADAAFNATYGEDGSRMSVEPGSLDYFLAFRNVMFGMRRGRLVASEVRHRDWHVHGGHIEVQTNSLWSALGIEVAGEQPDLVRYTPHDLSVGWLAHRVTPGVGAPPA